MQTSGKGAKSRRIFLALARVQPVLAPAKCANERKGREKPQDFLSPCPSAACLGAKNRRGTTPTPGKRLLSPGPPPGSSVGAARDASAAVCRSGIGRRGMASRRASLRDRRRGNGCRLLCGTGRLTEFTGRLAEIPIRLTETSGRLAGEMAARSVAAGGASGWRRGFPSCGGVPPCFAGSPGGFRSGGAGEAGGRLPDFLPGDGGCGRRIAYLCSRMAAKSCFRVNK